MKSNAILFPQRVYLFRALAVKPKGPIMDFTYTDSQQDIQALANKILQDQVSFDSHRELEQARQDTENFDLFDHNCWQHLASAGLLGIALNENSGGMGFGFSELSLLLEEAGRVLAPMPLIPATISALTLQHCSNDIDLSACATGETFYTIAVSEAANQGSLSLSLRANDNGLTGEKLCVPYANTAGGMLVSANDNGQAKLYFVDKQAPGLSLEPLLHTSGEPSYKLTFSNTPARYIGDSSAVAYLCEHYAAALCAYQVGVSEAAMRLTASYVGEREQFGVKIGTFQAVGHRAANCFIDVSCLRLVTQQAVSRLNDGRDASTAVTIAKCWAGDAGHRVSYASQHLHGGFGVDKDYGLWRYATHSKWTELTLGGTQFHLSQLGAQIAVGNYDIE